jgi:excisionase family DNA binding protein
MSALPAAPLTVKDVAALASVHEHTVRRAIRDGHLEAFRRLGSTVYTIHPAAFERWAYGERVAPRAHPATFRHRGRPPRPPRVASRACRRSSVERQPDG